MVMLKGHVKWFDTSKGYGFLVVEDGSGDILLHANVLKNFGRGSVAEGTLIDFEVQETERGRQVSKIFDIEAPKDETAEVDESGFGLPAVEGIEMVPARVKWFDKSKGFGFANSFTCFIVFLFKSNFLLRFEFKRPVLITFFFKFLGALIKLLPIKLFTFNPKASITA